MPFYKLKCPKCKRKFEFLMSIRDFDLAVKQCKYCMKEFNECIPLVQKKDLSGISFRMKKI